MAIVGRCHPAAHAASGTRALMVGAELVQDVAERRTALELSDLARKRGEPSFRYKASPGGLLAPRPIGRISVGPR